MSRGVPAGTAGTAVVACHQCGALGGRLCLSSGVPSKCELIVLTWERRLSDRGACGGVAGVRGCEPRGPDQAAFSRWRPRRGASSPLAATLGLCSGFFESGSGPGGWGGGGAPARSRVPGEKWREAPPPLRLRPALSRPLPGAFISSARGRTKKARIPPDRDRCFTALRAPRPSPESCPPARPLPQPAPTRPPWSVGFARRAAPGCSWRPVRCCSCCAQTCVWTARCWRRWCCWLPSTGCASACCPRWPHSPWWLPPAGSRCPAWRASRACLWPLARCSSPVSAQSTGTPGSRAGHPAQE